MERRVKVTKLWRGKTASVRDYVIERALAKGADLVIEHGTTQMTISYYDLKKKFSQFNKMPCVSRYNGEKYFLYDVPYIPDNAKQYVMEGVWT